MRFKKGTMVEVLYKEEVPSGSWRCAEIVAGNGHNYDVKYELPLCATGTKLVERVSRKQIRPCPPPVGGAVDWMPGDLVEVIDNTSWKIATILKVLGGSYITIKLFWSSQELRVHETCLRVRQSWKHDRWVVVGKGSVITEEGKSNRLSTSRFNEKSTCQLPVRVKKVKRKSPFAASQVKAYNESGWKIRAIEKDGRRQRMVPDHPSLFLEKGQSWQLVHLTSKGLKMILGVCHLSLAVGNGEKSASSLYTYLCLCCFCESLNSVVPWFLLFQVDCGLLICCILKKAQYQPALAEA